MKKIIIFDFAGVIDRSDPDDILTLSKKFKLFIVSNSYHQTIDNFLASKNIQNCFTEILGLDVGGSKAERFKMIFAKYSLKPEAVLFITDSVSDIQEAKIAKLGFIIAINSGMQTPAELTAAEPNIVVNNFKELEKAINIWDQNTISQ